MPRSEIREIVTQINPIDTLEKSHTQNVLDWIDSGAELCRLEKPAVPPKHLVSYFVLYDPDAKKLLLGSVEVSSVFGISDPRDSLFGPRIFSEDPAQLTQNPGNCLLTLANFCP